MQRDSTDFTTPDRMTLELLLMSPYTPPERHALTLGADETACWLNAWSALWHPAALRLASAPPRWLGPYDKDEPGQNWLLAKPSAPPLYLPADFDERVRAAGGICFDATPRRDETLANLSAALAELTEPAREWPADRLRCFHGLGLGYLVIETLFSTMERERTLDVSGFWNHVQAAIAEDDARASLTAAAAKLLAARETLYPADIALLDFAFFDSMPDRGSLPLNVMANGQALEARESATGVGVIRAGINPDPDTAAPPAIELCGGPYIERADDLLPLESQLWNLRRGRSVARDHTGANVGVYAQRICALHAQMPLVLHRAGINRSLQMAFDDAKLPNHRAAVVHWPAGDGRQVESFCRVPQPADDPLTYFHLAHFLHQTIMQDSSAVLALLHANTPAAPWLDDWRALSELAPVLGTWTTVSHFLRDATGGEYASVATADDFAIDHLDRLVSANEPRPVSRFRTHWRRRRQVDAAWTWLALLRSLGARADDKLEERLRDFETRIECEQDGDDSELDTAGLLAERILSHATGREPGLMLLNPCAFARRVTVDRTDFTSLPPISPPVRAAQRDDNATRLVVDIPALGFAWVPNRAPASPAQTPARPAAASVNAIRNEFFEAEIDAKTGGLRAIRDLKTRENRVGMQLAYQPGSAMHAKSVAITARGPALAEITTEGALLDEQQAVLAVFRQRFRAWAGRPILEIHVQLMPEREPQGYSWHAYYGARFAWRDERATLVRGNGGIGSVTTHSRPVTPEFIELRSDRLKTLVLPQGLPFHQRHGGRMLDVILIPPGETARQFDLAIALDRDLPGQTAWGVLSPIAAVPVASGPPHVGATGWLAHLDAANLLLTSLQPAPGRNAVIARLQEVTGHSVAATMRFARNPTAAEILEPDGTTMMPLSVEGDAVQFETAGNEWIEMRVDFGS